MNSKTSRVKSSAQYRNLPRRRTSRRKMWVLLISTAVLALILVGVAIFRVGAGRPKESTATAPDSSLPLAQAGAPLRGGHVPALIPQAIPTPRAVPEGQPAPKLNMPVQEFDFGRVSRDALVTHIFTVSNLGTADLHITTLVTSCGCTTAELTSSVIPPGQRAELKVIFDADFHPVQGSVTRSVWMATNDPGQPWVEIRMTGFVE